MSKSRRKIKFRALADNLKDRITTKTPRHKEGRAKEKGNPRWPYTFLVIFSFRPFFVPWCLGGEPRDLWEGQAEGWK
jgi:hypothetical protein